MSTQSWDPQSPRWPLTPVGKASKDFLLSRQFSIATRRSYGATLLDFADCHSDRDLSAFEPSAGGTELIEKFLRDRWGTSAARTYNKNLTVMKGLFKWLYERERLVRDPASKLEFKKKDGVNRETFTQKEVDDIFRENPDPRDRVPLRLLLQYALSKSELQGLRFRNVDREARQIRLVGKGRLEQTRPIVGNAFWEDFDRLCAVLTPGPSPDDYVLISRRTTRRTRHILGARDFEFIEVRLREAFERAENLEQSVDLGPAKLVDAVDHALQRLERARVAATESTWWKPGTRFLDHGVHSWWYRCLQRAGVVASGVTSGANMNMARLTAGQLFYEATGDIKGVQTLMGHASIQSTAVAFSSPDVERLRMLLRVIEDSLPGSGESG